MKAPDKFAEPFDRFLAGVRKRIGDYYLKNYSNGLLPAPEIAFSEGGKYIKLIRYDHSGAVSVYCFVDKATGDVLKAASWKQPAKHARSNIYDEDYGLSGVSVHGAQYLL